MKPIQSDEWVEENRFDAPALYYELQATRAVIEALLEQRDEARRLFCEERFHNGNHYRSVGGDLVICASPEEIADDLGWYCFKTAQD